MRGTARRAATATLVALSIVVGALALWKIKAVIALLFLAFTVAAAMRPGVEWLHRRLRIPRGLGVLIHYLTLLGVLALLLWLIVPRALSQVEQAIGNVPTSSTELRHQANHSTGIKHEILSGIDKRLRKLPSGSALVHPAYEEPPLRTVGPPVLNCVIRNESFQKSFRHRPPLALVHRVRLFAPDLADGLLPAGAAKSQGS